ncbi:thioredoxin family protein [Kitasatospora sp. NPDC059747]|uniref:thioredoxin family protein n=1 Tax=Kitasatospora sp. NPDC059747 TaxID=3346930 RepID=UPI00365DB7D9
MRIRVLTVPDCPNAPVVERRLTAALGEREAAVEFVEVTDTAQAERWGMTGSPTVLLDGVDPFAVSGAPASVSCRLYRDAEGRIAGAPSVADLRRALEDAGQPVAPVTETAAVEDVDVLDPTGRAGRGRLAPT